MRRIFFLLITALALALSATPAALAQADRDGQACENFAYAGGGTGGGTGGDDGSLPFTGPSDTLLPAGATLLLAGLALVG